MGSKKPILYAVGFLLLYSLILRPLLFWIQATLVFPLVLFITPDSLVLVGENARWMALWVDNQIVGEWAVMFGYVSLVFPFVILLAVGDFQKALWIIALHVFVTLITLLFFLAGAWLLPEIASLNNWIYGYIMIGASYAILALGLTEFIKKLKSSA